MTPSQTTRSAPVDHDPPGTPDGLTIPQLIERGILADEPPSTVRGRALRFLIVDELRTHEVLSVAEMVTIITERGFHIPGRASKTISDALRWERARGRVVRISRGLYRYGQTPATTARRIKLFAAHCRAWLVAPTRSQHGTQSGRRPRQHPVDGLAPAPPPALRPASRPPSVQQPFHQPPHRPSGAPWEHLGWLWST